MRECRVILTDKCNLDCSFCCMKEEKIHDSFTDRAAFDIAAAKFDIVKVSGGEPLMEYKKLVQFICLVRYFNPDSKIYLYTNGILLHLKTAETLQVAGLDGINWTPHQYPTKLEKQTIAFVHACLIPVRMLIQDKLVDDDILKYALDNSMQINQWTIGDCDNMESEDRYRIDWSVI